MKKLIMSVAAFALAFGAMIVSKVPRAAGDSVSAEEPLGVSSAAMANAAVVSESATPTSERATNEHSGVKTFVGTIAKSGDQFILVSEGKARNAVYQLDDQHSASKFEDKQVKVTGVLDASNNTIRVQSIEPASA